MLLTYSRRMLHPGKSHRGPSTCAQPSSRCTAHFRTGSSWSFRQNLRSHLRIVHLLCDVLCLLAHFLEMFPVDSGIKRAGASKAYLWSFSIEEHQGNGPLVCTFFVPQADVETFGLTPHKLKRKPRKAPLGVVVVTVQKSISIWPSAGSIFSGTVIIQSVAEKSSSDGK